MLDGVFGIGEVLEILGFILVVGFLGYGFGIGFGVGYMIVDLVMGEKLIFDFVFYDLVCFKYLVWGKVVDF